MRRKLPKGFISIGNGNTLNIDCIVDVKYDPFKDKVYIKDKFGISYTLKPKDVKGKLDIWTYVNC